jgi:dipeptidyl aminopeptidase/acylaminoacyl peptidase
MCGSRNGTTGRPQGLRHIGILLAALLLPAIARGQTRRAITIDDLLAFQRISEPRISPDGASVAYTVTTPDRPANRNARNVWIVPTAGGAARQLTASGKDNGARWSPDGKRLAFISSRDGDAAVYLMALTGGEPTRLTTLSGGADNIVWSPDGKRIAFTSQMYPDCKDEACNAKRARAAEENKVKAHVAETLLYRHWTEWRSGQRGHLFIVSVDGGTPKDLTPGADYDVPPLQREGPHPIAFSPDGNEIAFTAVVDPMEAASTNGDIFTVPSDGSAAPKKITTGPGFDGAPAYSPDGKWIAFHSQDKPGVESARWRLMRYDRASGQETEVSPSFDRSVDAIAWSPDSATLYFNAEDKAFQPIFSVAATGGMPQSLTPKTFNAEWALSSDGKTLVMARSSQAAPAELVVSAADGSNARPLTTQNADLLAKLDLPSVEHFTFAGAGGTDVHAMLLRPPAFEASKKYPVVMILHGGPETMFGDTWSFRWNTQMFAAPGYAVLMINRRGSTGFGQAFADAIQDDWGGQAFEDVMKGLDAALAKFPFLDGTRVAAAGASYGGYMIDWLASQSKGRFKVLVSHAGVYDLTSMYGATEELWFPEAEFKGTPWTNRAGYEKWSPDRHAAEFGQYKTPTLVTAGELDFRVPYTQSLEFYTALQRQGVPSRLVVFPDEGHWILKPQNSAFWYGQVMEWLRKYLEK